MVHRYNKILINRYLRFTFFITILFPSSHQNNCLILRHINVNRLLLIETYYSRLDFANKRERKGRASYRRFSRFLRSRRRFFEIRHAFEIPLVQLSAKFRVVCRFLRVRLSMLSMRKDRWKKSSGTLRRSHTRRLSMEDRVNINTRLGRNRSYRLVSSFSFFHCRRLLESVAHLCISRVFFFFYFFLFLLLYFAVCVGPIRGPTAKEGYTWLDLLTLSCSLPHRIFLSGFLWSSTIHRVAQHSEISNVDPVFLLFSRDKII